MPKDPKGEKRPADVVCTAIKVAKIATPKLKKMPKLTTARTRPRKNLDERVVRCERRI